MSYQEIVDSIGAGIKTLTPGKFLFGGLVITCSYFGLAGFCNRNATKQGHFFECRPLGIRSGPTASSGLYLQNSQRH